MIEEIGNPIDFTQDCYGVAINPQEYYLLGQDLTLKNTLSRQPQSMLGQNLLAISRANFKNNSEVNQCAKRLFQIIFKHYRHGKPLKSMQLWQDMQQYIR